MQPEGDCPPEPWRTFFEELDHQLSEPVSIHCLGGFVLVHQYRVARTTVDVDFAAVVPHRLFAKLVAMGGKASPLSSKHRVFLDPVTVATFPENYVSRLKAIYAGVWKHLELQAVELGLFSGQPQRQGTSESRALGSAAKRE